MAVSQENYADAVPGRDALAVREGLGKQKRRSLPAAGGLQDAGISLKQCAGNAWRKKVDVPKSLRSSWRERATAARSHALVRGPTERIIAFVMPSVFHGFT